MSLWAAMPFGIKWWTGLHITSGFTAGSLFVWVAEQGTIDDASITLFAAIGFAVFSFVAGWRLSTEFSKLRERRATDKAEAGKTHHEILLRLEAIESRWIEDDGK